MKKIKAIPTTYANTNFRSKLEAEWAKYFDSINMDWAYEVEGYELPDGTWYLPDFWLPNCKTFFEVKGIIGEIDINKVCQLAEGVVHKGIMVVIGGVKIPESIGLVFPFPAYKDPDGGYDAWGKECPGGWGLVVVVRPLRYMRMYCSCLVVSVTNLILFMLT